MQNIDMKILSIISAFLFFGPCCSNLANAENLIWWNTGRGGKGIYDTFENDMAKKINLQFNRTLDQIIKEENPEIMTLGECMPDTISNNNWQTIKAQYPYIKFIPYNEREKNWGILILSKIIPTSIVVGALDYVPLTKSAQQKRVSDIEYRQTWLKGLVGDPNEKPFIQMVVTIAGQQIALYPLHFMQPWQQIIDQEGYAKFVSEIYYGNQNPLMNQMAHFFNTKSKHQKTSAIDGSIMFGDFNCPETFLASASMCFNLWDWQYRDLTEESFATYPSPHAYLQLDHAFAEHLELHAVATRLVVQGSDHYPLSIKINH